MSVLEQPEVSGIGALLKQAIERFELRTLADDAVVAPSAYALLEAHVGAWSGTMSTWLTPGEPYDVQDVTSSAVWSVGGKVLARTFHGRFIGRPFEALCLIGHDAAADRYVASWVDSATTAMLRLDGTGDNGVLTLDGAMKMAPIVGATLDVRTTLALVDRDHLRIQISVGRLGIYFTAHVIEMTRVTPA